jgi:FkbM family methyltransferase
MNNNFDCEKIIINDFYLNIFPNDWMGMNMRGGNLWEPHISKFLLQELRKDSHFVDVGSNYGYHSIFASKHCEKVHSFEPSKFMNEIQKLSILSNDITNIDLYPYALGDTDKKVHLTTVDVIGGNMNVGEMSVVLSEHDSNDVHMKKLDDVIQSRIDIMKIDVQGFEKFVISGASKLIQKYQPHIIVEMENYQLGKFGYNSEKLINQIREYDYDIFLLDYHYPSDLVCIHKNNVSDFRLKNDIFIKKLTQNNTLNNCLDFGVLEKVDYGYEITSNSIKKI